MTVYEECRRLFDGYPLAVSGGRLMTLATPGAGRFHFLARVPRGWQMWPWHGDGDAFITPDGGAVPPDYRDALTQGVPMPRQESVFGWVSGRQVTALILSYTEPAPEVGQPHFSVMAPAGGDWRQWPPFADATVVASAAREFWDACAAGRIADLTGVIGGSRDTVLWVPAEVPGGGAGVIAVREQVTPGDGQWTLPAGVYVFSRALRAGHPAPSLAGALAAGGAADLGPAFSAARERRRL